MPELHSNGGGQESRLDRMERMLDLIIQDHAKGFGTVSRRFWRVKRDCSQPRCFSSAGWMKLTKPLAVVDGLVREQPPLQ